MQDAWHIVSLNYVAVASQGVRMDYWDAAIHMWLIDKYDVYVMECACGLSNHMPENDFIMGLTLHGGEFTVEDTIGVRFAPYHRWIALHCGRCGRSQLYEKRTEFERNSQYHADSQRRTT